MMTVAAYMAFALNAQLGWPLLPSTAVAAVAMGVLCIGIDQVTFKPLRERGGITLMVASLGWASSSRTSRASPTAFGAQLRHRAGAPVPLPRREDEPGTDDHARRVDRRHDRHVAAAHALADGTSNARGADNPSLALVRGIESPRVIAGPGSSPGAASSGWCSGRMDRALEPPMGSNYLISVFAAAILGGLGSPLGAFAGALVIAW